jgi:hypothetical protein
MPQSKERKEKEEGLTYRRRLVIDGVLGSTNDTVLDTEA